MIDRNQFLPVRFWMIEELGLKGNDLLVYALIYRFSTDERETGDQWFYGSRNYLAEWTKSTKRGIAKNLENLLKRGLIEQRTVVHEGIRYCHYRVVLPSEPQFIGDEQSSTRAMNKVHRGDEQSSSGVMNKVHTENRVLENRVENRVTDNPPSPMYSLRNDKETSYGTEEGNISKLLTGEYIGYPPQGEAPSAPSKPIKKNSSDIPFEEIRDLYNTICTSLPKCRTVTDKRKAAIRARWKDGFGLADFEEAFKAAQESRFLKGQQGERAWRADFDFLISPKMVKVLEGAYSGKVDFTELGFSDRGSWEGDVDNGDF